MLSGSWVEAVLFEKDITHLKIRDWEQDNKVASAFPWDRVITYVGGIPEDPVLGQFDKQTRMVRYQDHNGNIFYGLANASFKRPIMSRGKKATSLAYALWRPSMILPVAPIRTKNSTLDLSKWQSFPLYDPEDNEYQGISQSNLPPKLCHLADRVVGKLISMWADEKITKEELHKRWPSTFDTRGFIYVNRQPLGTAAKAINPLTNEIQYLIFHDRYTLFGNERTEREMAR